MNDLRIDDQVPAKEWDRFVVSHHDGHLLQTSAWGQLKSEFGWLPERLVVRSGSEIVAGTQVLYRRLPLGWTIAYVPKGPLADYANVQACDALFHALHHKNRARRSVFAKVEPDITQTAEARDAGSAAWARHGFEATAQTVQPRQTVIVDIARSEQEILRQMKSKTRYNVRLAERKGVRVYEGGAQDIDALVRLMTITGERDEFGIRSPLYYERAFKLFEPSGMVGLFVAAYGKEPIAALMAFACGTKSWYMFGASGNAHRERMPNYALQWAAIRWARTRGCQTYDLYGVPDEETDVLEANFATRRDGLWGVYRFKRGFGGTLTRYVGAFDHVYSRRLYWLYRRILALRAGREHE